MLCVIGVSALMLLVIVISIPYWHSLLLRLLSRSWDSVVDSLRTRAIGYAVAEIIFPVIVFFAAFIRQSGIEERVGAAKRSLSAAIAAALATIFVWASTFGWSVAKTTYNSYRHLTLENSRMREENERLSNEIVRIKTGPPPSERAVVRHLEELAPGSVTESPRITALPVLSSQRPGVRELEYLLTTNVARTPVELVLACDFPIADTLAVALTPTSRSVSVASNNRLSPKRFMISMPSFAWSPTVPIWVTIFFERPVNGVPSCSFSSP